MKEYLIEITPWLQTPWGTRKVMLGVTYRVSSEWVEGELAMSENRDPHLYQLAAANAQSYGSGLTFVIKITPITDVPGPSLNFGNMLIPETMD